MTCVYVDSPSFAKYLLIALAVMDLPRVGNRCPSEEDKRAGAEHRGQRQPLVIARSIARFAARSVSSRTYHSAVQASTS